ncbi:MAG: FecR family protein [Pseudomonadota bacterium]
MTARCPMYFTRPKQITAGVASFTVLFLAGLQALAAENVGAATAITNDVSGRLGAAETRFVDGDPVFQNQTIRTGDQSIGQFEFADRTNLAVAENSTIVIDRHVYDPDRGTGEIALNAVGGAFRFVTGLVPKEEIVIHTPTATLGVRGTTFDLYVHENGEAAITLIEGEVEVCNANRACRILSEAGKVMHIAVDGLISEARDWGNDLVDGVQYAAAFPFLTTSRSALNQALRSTGRNVGSAANEVRDAADDAGRAAVNGVRNASSAGANAVEDAGDAVADGARETGAAVSRTGRKASDTVQRSGRNTLRRIRRLGR